MAVDLNDERLMRRAIELGRRVPKYPFGAVVVDRESGKILGEGTVHVHEDAGGLEDVPHSPVMHGEIAAILDCARNVPGVKWEGLGVYTTAEPCPMCQSAIAWGRMTPVVWGTSIETLSQLGYDQIDISAEEVNRRTSFHTSELIGGVLEEECDRLFERGMRLIRQDRSSA